MTLGNRLRDARKRAGYTQRQLANQIGAKHNSVSNWENGLNLPDPITIEQICETLSVSPNYLLMGDEMGTYTQDGFDLTEVSLVKKYRGLDKNARGAVDALLNYYCGSASIKVVELTKVDGSLNNATVANAKNTCENAPSFEVVIGLISTQSVAAGTGTYLDRDAFEKINVAKNDLTRRADFYVPVAGNSMEPEFHDGDILIIERAAVRIGEIGIFTLDGSGFVKVRGKNELISLNADYAPIPMNDAIVCNGKVIGILEPEWLAN